MPIKVAIKTALSNESAAFPPALHSPRPAQTPRQVSSTCLLPRGFRPSLPSPPAISEPQTGAALPVSGSVRPAGNNFEPGNRNLPPPPVQLQPGVSQGREPWKKPQKISRRNVGACLGRYECAKELWGLCRGLASLQLGTNAVI